MLTGNHYDPKYMYVKNNMIECMPLMAPGWLTQNTSAEENTLAARGLMPNLDSNGTRNSLCYQGQPCKEFNNFLKNGSLEDLGKACNYSGAIEKM